MSAWSNPIYQRTVLIVLSFLFTSGLIVYFLRKKNYYFITSWASIKSWLIAAPLMFGIFGAPPPWPLITLTIIALFGVKVFFQIMGMYHRSYFVLITYAGIIALGLCIYWDNTELYNLMPMIFLGALCLVPLVRNSYKRMIQYISLTLLGFIFLGWSFMHLGLIIKLHQGLFQVMYLVILTEFCDNTNLALGRQLGKRRWLNRINPRRTLESTVVSVLLTIVFAGFMRFMLPEASEDFWWMSGLIAALAGILGDLVMTVIRRDLGIRVMGLFVLGRGDFLRRVDRLVFVAPIYYYSIIYLPIMKL